MQNRILNILLLILAVSCKGDDDTLPTLPKINIIAAFSIDQSSALARGALIEVNKSSAEEYGFVWGQTLEPDISGNNNAAPYITGTNTTQFSLQLNNLIVGQTYYIRAYIRNGSEIIYSNTISFTHQGPFVWKPLSGVIWSDRQHTAYSTILNGGVYVIRPVSQTDTEVWLYIPWNDTWTQQPNLDLPSTRYDPFYITLNKFGGEQVFIGGGYQINENVPERYVYLKDCFEFYISTNGKGFDYFDFPFGNSQLTSFVIDNRAYALSMDARKDFAEFQDGIIWNIKKKFPGEFLGRYVSFAIGNKGYVLVESMSTGATTRDFYEYDPDADNWTKKAAFPGRDRMNGIAFSVDGKGYYGAGRAKDVIEGLRDLWQYNPGEDKWEKFVDFPGTGNVRLIANTIGEKVYIGLGYKLENSAIGAEQYTTAYDYWQFSPKGNN